MMVWNDTETTRQLLGAVLALVLFVITAPRGRRWVARAGAANSVADTSVGALGVGVLNVLPAHRVDPRRTRGTLSWGRGKKTETQ